jgi:pSer/pThr/pTyr-binding forkhead associated (FHA) protein
MPTQPLSEALDEPRRTVALVGAPVAILETTTPPRAQHLIFPGTLEVGARAPADVLIERPEVSSRHARIRCEQSDAGSYRILLDDSGSTNGTFVNGKRVDQATLQEGDRVRFANVEFVLRFLATTESRVTLEL